MKQGTDDRYSRQELIPGWDQDRLSNSSVVIAGVGAIGSYVSTILASSGVGTLHIIDFDTIEISNLNRQLLFQEKDVGKPKVEVAAEKLREINPDIKIFAYNKKMEEVPVSVYQNADVIIGCLDTFIGRRWINSMALRVHKPLILGGMYAFLGDVQVIFPYKTPCFECQPLVSERELAQACTPFGEKRKEEREEEEEEAKLPAVATLSAIIGGTMSQEALKIMLNIGEPLNNYLFYDGLHNATTIVELARNKNCPACGEEYQLKQIKYAVNPDEKIYDLLVRLSLSYGLTSPELMARGQKLDETKTIKEYNITDGTTVFVLDETLAKPIKLVLHFA